MRALSADRSVRVSTPRGEIVGAYHGNAAFDLAPAADMVGGGEARDSPLVVIVSEAGEAADLAEASGVE